MTLTVVGSIAFDAVETPSGSRDRLLGGSAVHFAIASSQFAETRIVGPVPDQSMLFGLLDMFDGLHIEVVSVNPVRALRAE